jgi:trehalose-6-phosphatase
VRSPARVDKGTAVLRMANALGGSDETGSIVFIGDDTTDETVFAVLPEWNGVGFSVGRKFVGATGCFATPHDVRTWLSKISKQDTHRNS